MELKAIEKAGIIRPRAVDPASPVTTAGSSGLFSAAMRDRGTYGGAQEAP